MLPNEPEISLGVSPFIDSSKLKGFKDERQSETALMPRSFIICINAF
jgi:hypothetical protein